MRETKRSIFSFFEKVIEIEALQTIAGFIGYGGVVSCWVIIPILKMPRRIF